MSKLWEEIKENVKEWSSTAIEKAEEVSKLAVEKTGDFTKVSKIKLDIRQVNKDIDETFEDLGRYVYLQAKDENITNFKTNKEFNNTLEKIDGFKSKIKGFEKTIDEIKTVVEGKAEEVKKAVTKKAPVAKKKPPVKKPVAKKAPVKKPIAKKPVKK